MKDMFKSPQAYRTFLSVVFTYLLDLVGYSIVFPVLAPLFLNPQFHFFPPGTPEIEKTTLLGLLFAMFGIAQFLGAPIIGAIADHFGRYKAFLGSIGLSILGYVLMAVSIYWKSIGGLFIGRLVTGFCSGSFSLAQSATADLTDEAHRSKAFGILIGVGGLGFVAGPWIGGKLSNPHWLYGSGAFIFSALAALINFAMILFFFNETKNPHKELAQGGFFHAIKDLKVIFHHKMIRTILITQFFFYIGYNFFLVFSPTFLVQRFSMGSNLIGDFFAYMALWWSFGSMILNKQLTGKFSIRSLILVPLIVGGIGAALYVAPQHLWPYWVIYPIVQLGSVLAFTNISSLLSLKAPENMQGRVMGAGGSMWSFGQIIAPLAAGPLAGWNIHFPILFGAAFFIFAFFYFLSSYIEVKS